MGNLDLQTWSFTLRRSYRSGKRSTEWTMLDIKTSDYLSRNGTFPNLSMIFAGTCSIKFFFYLVRFLFCLIFINYSYGKFKLKSLIIIIGFISWLNVIYSLFLCVRIIYVYISIYLPEININNWELFFVALQSA